MRLGIDFGTTHTVVALVDRGNYPGVGFEWGDVLPSQLAVRLRDGLVRFGHEAVTVTTDPEWVVVRSFKRLLNEAGPLTEVRIGPHSYRIGDLLAGHFTHLRRELETSSNCGVRRGEPIELAVSVPANASNDQRFLTMDAFRRAGFEVLALLNEPSAAGFEYAHRFRSTFTSRREFVLVYDDVPAAAARDEVAALLAAMRREEFAAADGGTFRCSFSAGVAEWTGGTGLADVVQRADDALYRAKDAGRARVVVADA